MPIANDIGAVITMRGKLDIQKTVLTTSVSCVFRNDRSTSIPGAIDTTTLCCNLDLMSSIICKFSVTACSSSLMLSKQNKNHINPVFQI